MPPRNALARLPTGPFGAVRPALAATFMNQVTKSGGMAGLAMLVADGDRRRLGRGPVIAAYALVAVLTELAFAGALAAAIMMSWLGGHLTGPEGVACAVFAVYLAARVALLGVAATSRARLRQVYALPGRALGLGSTQPRWRARHAWG